MSLYVMEPGLLTTVQDLGRHGHQRDGVPVGGAMDPFALRIANLLVGNDEGAAAVEVTLSGPTLRFDRGVLIAIGGADLSASLDGASLPPWRPAWAPAGAMLSFGRARSGCRAYLAVAGGIDVDPVLGSRSTFVRAGLGGVHGRAIRRDDMIPVATPSALASRIADALRRPQHDTGIARWGAGPSLLPGYSSRPTIRLLPGAHMDALTTASHRELCRAQFRVSPQSDRMGYRLDGPPMELAAPLEILSEAVTFGTLQLPPDGRPIALMADRQTTGGYPRIGEVASVDLPLLAQVRPGELIRFRPCSLTDALELLLARESAIARFAHAISLFHR